MSRFNRWWVWCLLALLAGLVAGWAMPPPPLPKQKPMTDTWSWPANPVPSRTVTSELRQGIDSVRWDGDATGTGPQGPWRLAGIASGPIALIEMQQDKKMLRLSLGAELPDGSVLMVVRQDRIEVEQNRCVSVYQLYNLKPVESRGEGCPEPPSDADTAPASAIAPTANVPSPSAGQPPRRAVQFENEPSSNGDQ